jgi:hypothetical protein
MVSLQHVDISYTLLPSRRDIKRSVNIVIVSSTELMTLKQTDPTLIDAARGDPPTCDTIR